MRIDLSGKRLRAACGPYPDVERLAAAEQARATEPTGTRGNASSPPPPCSSRREVVTCTAEHALAEESTDEDEGRAADRMRHEGALRREPAAPDRGGRNRCDGGERGAGEIGRAPV